MTLQPRTRVLLTLVVLDTAKANITDRVSLFRAAAALAKTSSVSCTVSLANKGGAAEGLVVTVATSALNETAALEELCADAPDGTSEAARPKNIYPFMVTT